MNIRDFAEMLLSQCDELEDARYRNIYLENELTKYRQSVSYELAMHQETFGKILMAATTPNNSINNRMRGEFKND